MIVDIFIYRTSNKLEHHFSNIKLIRMCSSIGDEARKPNFWLQMNGHQKLNIIAPSLDLQNYSLKRLEYHFLERQMDLNVYILW